MAIQNISNNNISQGMTGIFSVSKGEMLYADRNKAEFFKKLTIGNEQDILMVRNGLPTWRSISDIMNALASIALSVSNLTVSGTVTAGSVVTDTLSVDTLNGVLKASGGLVSGGADTDDLPEGTTNLYYTDARVDTEIPAFLGYGTSGQLLATNPTVDGYEWVDPSTSFPFKKVLSMTRWARG